MREIYLDNAAATPIDSSVQKEVVRGMRLFGNPSSYNDSGRVAAKELQKSRTIVARFLGAHDDEIIFTASGSEANALAIQGLGIKGGKAITTPIEHKSVLENLGKLDAETVFVKVNPEGMVDLVDLEKRLDKSVRIVSIMYANNEIGTVEPIVQIGKIIKIFRQKNKTNFPIFHVDACQSVNSLSMKVDQLGVDLLSFNGSKIYGPRGVGVLYVRRGIEVGAMVHGGGQEFGLRAGTENLPAILGLAKAISQIKPDKNKAKLRDYFFNQINKKLKEVKINGPLGNDRLPNNINISIANLTSEQMLLELDKHGIRAGSGSACTARAVEPSHVLAAIGLGGEYLYGALRFSLGKYTTKKDIDYLLKVLPEIVEDLNMRYRMLNK